MSYFVILSDHYVQVMFDPKQLVVGGQHHL